MNGKPESLPHEQGEQVEIPTVIQARVGGDEKNQEKTNKWEILDLSAHWCNTKGGGAIMPTSNPRINIVCEEKLYYDISSIARVEKTSLSAAALSLIREALELREDRALAAIADERAETFDRGSALNFEQVFDE